jgi:hypothetical protein
LSLEVTVVVAVITSITDSTVPPVAHMQITMSPTERFVALLKYADALVVAAESAVV